VIKVNLMLLKMQGNIFNIQRIEKKIENNRKKWEKEIRKKKKEKIEMK
jgi:hypothetical protein